MQTDYQRAQADAQIGLMPTVVKEHPDTVELWTAFRRYVGTAWTHETLKVFIRGWDAAKGRDK